MIVNPVNPLNVDLHVQLSKIDHRVFCYRDSNDGAGEFFIETESNEHGDISSEISQFTEMLTKAGHQVWPAPGVSHIFSLNGFVLPETVIYVNTKTVLVFVSPDQWEYEIERIRLARALRDAHWNKFCTKIADSVELATTILDIAAFEFKPTVGLFVPFN